jgi:hypothetical protein
MLEWSLLSDATMQTDGLFATPHNNANTFVAIPLVTLVVVYHYYVRDCVYVEIYFLWLRGYSGRRTKSVVRVSELQFRDGLYAEVCSRAVVFTLFCSRTPQIYLFNFLLPELLVHNASYIYCIIYVPSKMSSRTPG